jgi:two-component system chemotaxis response regulator CheB
MSKRTTINVMIVDESFFIRKMIKTILYSEKNYQVVAESNSGAEAVSLARNLKPDIIVFGKDINGLSCQELREKLNLYENNFRVIIVSSYEKCKSCLIGFQRGRCDLIQKPFDPNNFLNVLNNRLDNSMSKAQTNFK